MGDLLLRRWPLFLAQAPIGEFRRSRVAVQRRRGGGSGGSGVWGLCRKRSVNASDLDLIYTSEGSDGSVVFRFGTASEIAEYVALKEAERESVAQVEGGTTEEDDVNRGEEEILESFEALETNLLVEDVEKCGVEMQKDEVGCTLGSSENLSGVRITGSYVGVSDSLDILSNVLVEVPSVLEDKVGSLQMGNVGVFENSGSFEIAVESGCDNELSDFENLGDSDRDFNSTFRKENVSTESSSVLDDNPKTKLEKDKVNVENASTSADDFGGNMVKDNTHLENSNAFDENADGNASNELVVAKSIVSDEDLGSDAGDQSTVLEEDIILLDPVPQEPDVTVSLSLDEASSYVDKEGVLSHSIDESINSSVENSDPVVETTDILGHGSDANGNIELSTTEETIISAADFEIDDREIPLVNVILTANEKMACESNQEYVASQKLTTSEIIQEENTEDFSSPLNILDSVSVLQQQPSANDISNQKDCVQTSGAAGSLIATNVSANLSTSEGGFSDKCNNGTSTIQDTLANSSNQEDVDGSNSSNLYSIDDIQTAKKDIPTSEVTEVSEADILRNNVAAISVSKATDQISSNVADREEAPVRLSLSVGAALLPKTLEALTGGEDAYFIAGETWFGVADGVGQWSLEGFDAGLYGHELMECCRRIVSNGDCSPTDTKEVLSCGAAETTLPGSATVLVAYFDGQVLHASNIGDTGFVIVRNGGIFSRSSQTVYDFHFPHQIQKGDNPLEFVELYEVELYEGDIIIAATDGLFDNMYDQEIASIVTKSLQANMSPEEVAAVLAVKAQEIGRSTSTRSPFADAAQAAGYVGYTGGKLDDVAVIVSVVQKSE